jgi:hypothetical protein
MKINEFNCISEHNNIDEYLEFYKYVKSNMKEPSWLGEFSLNELKNILNNEGKLFNFYDNNIIVCSMLYIPSNNKTLEKHNLKYDEDLVGSCGPIMVNPEYVENKFQKQMLELLDKYCKNIGKIYIFTKVHPDNIYSINNFISDGYKFVETYKTSSGESRSVYFKEI